MALSEKAERKVWRRVAYSHITIFVLLVLLVFSIRAVLGVRAKARLADRRAQAALADLALLEERKLTYQESIARLKTEIGREEEIRKKFRVVREGEQMIILMDEKKEVEEKKPVAIFEKSMLEQLFGWIVK